MGLTERVLFSAHNRQLDVRLRSEFTLTKTWIDSCFESKNEERTDRKQSLCVLVLFRTCN